MQSIGELAHYAEAPWQQEVPETDRSIKHLFLVLQGTYGTLFLSKYSSGIKDDSGRDLGMRATMRVWESALSKYTPAVVEQAASRLTTEFPEFPPNLTQFEAICRAAEPRKTHAELTGVAMLAAPPAPQRMEVAITAKNDGKDWARKIVARAKAGDKTVTHGVLKSAMAVVGDEE